MGHHGIGLRTAHYSSILESGLSVGLVEAISENFMGRGGRPLAVLERVRRDSPVVLHGVSLSLGGLDPIPPLYLKQLDALASRIEAAWVSDHLCFGTVGGHSGHDLWPIPFTEEALFHVARRVSEVQERLCRRIAVENVSSYVEYHVSGMSEWEFISKLLELADCDLLLDINNLYINASNHQYDSKQAIASIPTARIRQLHLAGHSHQGEYLFDTHGAPVSEAVWDLYRYCVQHHGALPTVIEWDENIPPLKRVLEESASAAIVEQSVLTPIALPEFRERNCDSAF